MREVVILGGGFAGLYAARDLKGALAHVTVIDRTNHHLFQPMLYQVATAALSPGDIAYPVRSVLRNHRNTDVLMGEVELVDVEARNVILLDGRSVHYDYLLVALGARHSYFGHDEWEPLAPGLKAITDALEVRRRILMAFELAEQERDPARRSELLNFVIVGGGPTGVEVAGAIAEIKEKTLKRDYRNINPREARVILLEGGDRILPPYPAKLSHAAQKTLERLGVIVRTGTLVTDVRPDGVVIGDGFIPSHCVIWAAGNKASPVLKSLGAPLDRQGRVIVEPDLTIPGHPEVFVLGDAASFKHQPGYEGSLPAVSPVAIQMGHYAARLIRRETADNALVETRRPFDYFDKGQLAVIGRGRAVADLHKLKFSGFFAWLTWIFVHIAYLIGFRNRVIVLTEWAISYFTYGKGARLINRPLSSEIQCE
ncbi:MAG TPA: NAD(P)/FAD-dependent oxidoreductase [Gemmatimonadales bacterium]|nr:NAD(P)/FAD-dependent oxidoreductase [Gemmatimonadales bacterium]